MRVWARGTLRLGGRQMPSVWACLLITQRTLYSSGGFTPALLALLCSPPLPVSPGEQRGPLGPPGILPGARLRLSPGDALAGDPLGLPLLGPLIFPLFGLCLSAVSQEIFFGGFQLVSAEPRGQLLCSWASLWLGPRSIPGGWVGSWPSLESVGKPGGVQGLESVTRE